MCFRECVCVCVQGVRHRALAPHPPLPAQPSPPSPAHPDGAQGRLGEAIAAYERALAASPSLEVVQANLAVALTERGTQLKLEGERVCACVRVGGVRGGCARGVARVERVARRSCAAAPLPSPLPSTHAMNARRSNPKSTRSLARTHMHTPAGDLEGGVRAYERALALRPRHAEALYNLGVALTEQGQTERAMFM